MSVQDPMLHLTSDMGIRIKFRTNSGEFGGEIGGDSEAVGSCMAPSVISVGIPGGILGRVRFSRRILDWCGFGQIGVSRGFAQTALSLVEGALKLVPGGSI